MKLPNKYIHDCIHGNKTSTFSTTCLINAGDKGWRKSTPDRCPWQWYYKDCPLFKKR